MSTETRPHLSASQLNMLANCGEAYKRRYVDGEKIAPGIAMLVGTGTHKGAEVNFTQKIESHSDLPKNQIVEAAVAGYEKALVNGYELSPDEQSRGATVVIGEGKDTVASLAELHAAEQAPDYQPVGVETEIVIPFPNASHDLVGYIDLHDDQRRVTDFKTAGRAKPQSEVDGSIQLTIYAAAYQRLTGEPPAEVRLDTLVKTKKPKRQVLCSHRGPADFVPLVNRINTALKIIEAGIFMPAPVGAWICSPKWCGYWSTCPYQNTERKAAGEANGD